MLFRRRLLLDAREGVGLRGYHLLAAAALIAERGPAAEFRLVTDDNPEAEIAITLFRTDTGRKAPDWVAGRDRTSFDLYLLMADRMPDDAVTLAAMTHARLTLVGLMFPERGMALPVGAVAADGHDTVGFAEAALRLLAARPRRGRAP